MNTSALRRAAAAVLVALASASCAADLASPERGADAPPEDDRILAQAAPTCASARLTPGDQRGTLQHGGRARTYLLHVPPNLKAGTAAPLVIDMHGFSRTAASQRSGSGWNAVSDREGFLVVYPEGIGNSWNLGGCCGTAFNSNVDDLGFLRALIAKLTAEACVDRERVYASGVSNGAGMTGRLSCDAADVIAGVSLVSSDLRTSPCKPVRPITEIAFRGTADTLEPYEGGLVGPPGGQYQSPGARGSFELYRKLNQCTGTPTTTAKHCESYTQCAEGVEVTLCTLPGVGHSAYTNRIGVDIAQVSWDAFERAPRRAAAPAGP
ncbi:MAG: PHB depolymerase family esterase [Polyangiales bacterium]